LRAAWVAGPPSPEKSPEPLPAKVLILPSGENPPDAVVVLVGDVEVSGRVQRQAGRKVQGRQGRRAAVAAVVVVPRARVGSNDALRGHFADLVVPGIGNIEVPGGIDGQAGRSRQRSPHRRPAVARETKVAVARKGSDNAL